MIDRQITYTIVFIIVSLGLLTAVPPIMPKRVVEPFSELGILGPNMKLGDYPSELSMGEHFELYLYNGNHEGRVTYYRTVVKVSDRSTNVSDTEPLNVPAIGNFDVVLADGQNATTPMILSLNEAGLNRRIVFELHKYDSGEGNFVYSGEWLQMWLNVTSPIN